jgi:uncharacterized protein
MNVRAVWAVAAAACLLAGDAACAQDGPIGAARPDPAGLSPPVVAGSPHDARIDGAKLASAQQLYDIVEAPALRAATRSLTTSLSVQLSGAMAGRDAEHAKAMVAAVSDGLTSITPQLQAEAVSHMAREFTADQLKEMLAFYASPTGRLAARRLPLVTQQTVGDVLTYLPAMMQGLQDSYCSRVKCTRAERKALADVAARVAATRQPAE